MLIITYLPLYSLKATDFLPSFLSHVSLCTSVSIFYDYARMRHHVMHFCKSPYMEIADKVKFQCPSYIPPKLVISKTSGSGVRCRPIRWVLYLGYFRQCHSETLNITDLLLNIFVPEFKFLSVMLRFKWMPHYQPFKDLHKILIITTMPKWLRFCCHYVASLHCETT